MELMNLLGHTSVKFEAPKLELFDILGVGKLGASIVGEWTNQVVMTRLVTGERKKGDKCLLLLLLL